MEGAPNQESLERAALVEALRTKGIEDLETRELLIAWTEKAEAEAMRIGTREAQVDFEIARALLYKDAGFVDAARETLNDLLNVVIAGEYRPGELQERDEYRDRIENLLSELG